MDYMARALHLAARALGTSSPNPAVGAVLVKEGRVVGEGWTQPPGQAHAEVVALEQAGPKARGATLYVTLEPCPHHGRTPPCADAIVAAGVAQVHLATIDPSPWANGAGRAALERAGIRTIVGTLEAQARRLNEGYLTWVERGRPLVTVAYAMSLDGTIAPGPLEDADELARAELERLKARADRSAVGLGSLVDEDPGLVELGRSGVTSLIVECGRADLARLLAAGLADKVVVVIRPELALGRGGDDGDVIPSAARELLALPELPGQGVDPSQARDNRFALIGLHEVQFERLGDTLMVVGYTRPCSPAS